MTREEAIGLGKDYFRKHKEEMVSLYRQVYGETISCSTCNDSIGFAFDYIRRNIGRPICKYKLHPGGKISNIDGHWTNYNMTDEVAERLIKEGYRDSFV